LVIRSSGGSRRQLLAIIAALLVAAAAYAFLGLGTFLAREDPLQPADAIFVLAGTELKRPLEGADLYFSHYAPVIVMTRERAERAVEVVRRRGLTLPPDVERAREVLVELGVPREAVMLPDRIHDSTAAEAITLRELAQMKGWRRVIVVTSRLHLRRAGFAMRRELRGTGIAVMMRGSRYDETTPERWWTSRADIREMLSELPKLIAYVLGLGA